MRSKDIKALTFPEKNKIVGNNRQPMQCVLLTPRRSHKIPMDVAVNKTNSPVKLENKNTINAMKTMTKREIIG